MLNGRTVDHRKALAGNLHGLIELSTFCCAAAREERYLPSLPESQRAVAFALHGGEFGADLMKGSHLDRLDLDHAEGPPRPVRDDGQVP